MPLPLDFPSFCHKMKNLRATIVYLIAILPVAWFPVASGQQADTYLWKHAIEARAVDDRIAAPKGFERVEVVPRSFADWLRHLPLKSERAPVLLFNGDKKIDQSVHAAVVDIDTGNRDLQQCADAVIRLRAEYLYSERLFEAIQFNFTNGDPAPYTQWRDGFRPEVTASKARWVRKAKPDSSYASFRKYLDTVFMYAGTQSLSRELRARRKAEEMQAGDVFIRGGTPGHAVIVIDMARSKSSGETAFLLAQSYMPAQDIHILINPNDRALSPWYSIQFGKTLRTPEWEFARTELSYFIEGGGQNKATSPDRRSAKAAHGR